MLYEQEESWAIISQLITQQIPFTYFGVQMLGGAVLPLTLLAVTALSRMPERYRTLLAAIASCFVLVGVLAMRWNVVIGGQLLSKSLRGFTTYVPPLGGIEGIIVAAVLMVAPFVLLAVLTRILPPWLEEQKATEPRNFRFRTSNLEMKQ